MTERLWMLLMVGAIGLLTTVVFQERNKVQSLETERSACSDQSEKLAFEASELNQQVTQLKEKQRETERESRRSSGKLAALEESLEKLEDERTVWEDEREKHKIREKHLKQQLDDFRSQLKASELTTNEASGKLAALDESLEKLEDERTVGEDEREKHKIREKHLKHQLDDFRSQLKASELTTNEGNANPRTHPMLIKEFKTRAALENNEVINGIAKLNEDIFVITSGSNVIERFDSATLLTRQTLTLQEYESLEDLQPCNRSQSLLVIAIESTGKKFIINANPYNKEIINSREVSRCIERLSVTEDCHVFATCYKDRKIIEYSSTGHLMQKIVLKPETGIAYPRRALKMADGNFIVCYDVKNAPSVIGVAIVNSDGDVLKSYSDPSNNPELVTAMAIDRLGNVLVAEGISGRVILLSPFLEYKRDIVTQEHGTRNIQAMLLDEVNGRLFVADSSYNVEDKQFEDGRVLVFDMK